MRGALACGTAVGREPALLLSAEPPLNSDTRQLTVGTIGAQTNARKRYNQRQRPRPAGKVGAALRDQQAQRLPGSGRRSAMGLRMMLLLVVLVPLTIGLVLVGGTVSLLLAQAVPSWLNE